MTPSPSVKSQGVLSTTRVEALSDGVFCFSMTLLVVTFDVMKLPEDMTDQKMKALILSQWPDFLHYVQSFIIVAAFWMEHHQQFHLIKHCDWKLIWMNIVALIFVVLIPMTNFLAGDFAHLPIVAALFEGNMFVAGLAFCVAWIYASRGRRLLDPALDAGTIRLHARRNLVIPFLSLAAMALSLLTPRGSTLLYFLAPPLILVIGRKTRAERTYLVP
jgi:uncharacterized membrane protein